LLLTVCLVLFDEVAARRRALIAFIAVAVLAAVFSFWTWSQGVYVGPHHPDLPGTVLRNPVTQGMGFAAACFLAVMLALRDPGIDRRLRFALVAAAVLLAANLVFVTSGRTGHLLLLILLGVAAVQLLSGWRRAAAIAVLPLLAALALSASSVLQTRFGMMVDELRDPLASENISGMGIRVVMWKVSAQMAAEQPLLGYGMGGFPAAYESAIKQSAYTGWAATPTLDPHNQYLLVQLQAGLLGTAAFAWFLLTGFRSRGPDPWRAAGRAMLLGWCASALATSVFTAFAESHLLMPLLGILLAPAAAGLSITVPPGAGEPPPAPR
jgi:O-antigen ligase